MGKSLFIGVLVLTVIFAAITITVQRHSSKVPEMLSVNLAEQQAANLAAYALGYGINKLLDGNVTFCDSINGYIDDFTPLEVLDGSIDSIKFTNESDGSIRINSYVTYNINDKTVNHQSEANFSFIIDDEAESNITSALVYGGSITIHAKAVITGELTETTEFNFEEVFGLTEQEVKDEAISNDAFIINPENNTPMPDSLTWIEFEGGDSLFKITNDWTGAGILIIKGNLKCTAHTTFNGILVVFGTLDITAHSNITGSVFVVGDTSLGAHATITFDGDIVATALESLPFNVSCKIISWKE